MRGLYEVAWKAHGTAEVLAASESEAEEAVAQGCSNFADIDFEDCFVDGVDVEVV